MKRFSQFLIEVKSTKASTQAQRLGLTGDGHGGWYKDGEFVAKTEGDRLVFYNQGQKPGRDAPQQRTQANQQPVATQTKTPAASPQQQQQPVPQQEPIPQDQGGEGELEKPKKNKGTLTVAFGRFNPPTTGHEKLLDAVADVAGKGDYKIYPSRSNDPKKNPLDPDTKISYMRKMYPKHSEKIMNDAGSKTIFDVLKQAHADGYSDVNIVVGSDRQAEFEKLSKQYNGQLYDFKNLNVVSAGERDADAEGVEGMSASKLRKAAAEGDFKTFRSGVPSALEDKEARQLYNHIRKTMSYEEFELWEIAPKFDWQNLRENYIEENIFKVGDIVENLNTGLVGKIIRRGTNYLICVTEDSLMFKSWIKDVKEWTEVSGVPANQREVGTDSYRNYAMKMTGTTLIKNFINKYKVKSKN